MNKNINKNTNEVINYINLNILDKPIILVGMMGAGKTAIGKMLAKSLNRIFFDIDENIEKQYRMKIYDIFEQYGESKFREIEHEEIKKINIKSNYIIATGGGAFTFERNYNILNQVGLTVWLDVNQKTIVRRLKKSINNRPLLKNVEIDKYVSNLILKRNPLYSKAHLSVISKNESKIEITNRILINIKSYLVDNKNV
ncbi:MAG: shikimate kinase [Alphaproteobacteria bacterium]|nr:shikimate kinase [Alphaproteobacteria bacterium]